MVGGAGSSLSALMSLPHLVVVVVVQSLSVVCPLPVSTPQAVACGGCCGGGGGGTLSSSLLLAGVVAGAGSLGHCLGYLLVTAPV